MPAFPPEEAAKIKVPALVLTGTDGPWSQQCIDAALCRILGTEQAKRAWIQGADHLMREDD